MTEMSEVALKRRRALDEHKRKKEIVAELTGVPIPKRKSMVTVIPNAPPQNVLVEMIEIEERKRQIEIDSLKTISRALETKTATCSECGGSGKTAGKQFRGYNDEGEPEYDNVEMVCNVCWGEGHIVRKNSERITEMVASKYFPKTNVNINMNVEGLGREGLLGFISSV